MEQFINTSTRLDNILDLVFCSDPSLILNCQQLVNSRSFSDHNSLFIQLSYALKHMEQHKRINHASTVIPDYNLMEGDTEDWARMNALLDKTDWEMEMENKSFQEMTNIILCHLEDKVQVIFEKKDNTSKEEEYNDNSDSEKKTSNNKSPRDKRKLCTKKKACEKK